MVKDALLGCFVGKLATLSLLLVGLYTWRVCGLLRCVQRRVLIGSHWGAGEGINSNGSSTRWRQCKHGLSAGLFARL